MHLTLTRLLPTTLALGFLTASPAVGATLTTTFATNNSQNGNVFDVNVLSPIDLLVTSFDLHLAATVTDIEVYGRPGTWVGFNGSPTGWSLLSTTPSVTGLGPGVPTPVDVDDFVLPAGSPYALYITSTSGTGTMLYTDGTSVGDVFTQNADLQILEGGGVAYPFSTLFTPRIWNGTITYQNVPEPTGTLLLGLGTLTLMVRRRRHG